MLLLLLSIVIVASVALAIAIGGIAIVVITMPTVCMANVVTAIVAIASTMCFLIVLLLLVSAWQHLLNSVMQQRLEVRLI